MAEYPLQFATQQIRRAFARAIGRSIPKILTELITNGDDSYRRLAATEKRRDVDEPSTITIQFERSEGRSFVRSFVRYATFRLISRVSTAVAPLKQLTF
jgi:hypothetical protein